MKWSRGRISSPANRLHSPLEISMRTEWSKRRWTSSSLETEQSADIKASWWAVCLARTKAVLLLKEPWKPCVKYLKNLFKLTGHCHELYSGLICVSFLYILLLSHVYPYIPSSSSFSSLANEKNKHSREDSKRQVFKNWRENLKIEK